MIIKWRLVDNKNSINVCYYHFHYLGKQNWNQKTQVPSPALLLLTLEHRAVTPRGSYPLLVHSGLYPTLFIF